MRIAMTAAAACVWSGVLTTTASTFGARSSSSLRKSRYVLACENFSAFFARRDSSMSERAPAAPEAGGQVAGVVIPLAAAADAGERQPLVGRALLAEGQAPARPDAETRQRRGLQETATAETTVHAMLLPIREGRDAGPFAIAVYWN